MSKRRSRHRQRAPSIGGKVIDLQTVEARSGASRDKLYDYVEDGLMPGPERLTGRGVGTGARIWREGHVAYASRVFAVRAAGGSRTLAALRLLVDELPPPNAAWVRQALAEVFIKRIGEDVTVGQVRQRAQNQRWTAERITRRVKDHPTMSQSDRDALQFTHDARFFSPTRNPADGIDRAKDQRAAITRLAMGRRLPGDEALPDMSALRVLDVIEHAADEAVWRVYHMARRSLVGHDREINAALRQVPLAIGRSDTEIVELFLPSPGTFPGIRPSAALLPAFMIALLLDPSAGELQAIGALFGILEQSHAPGLGSADDLTLPPEIVDSLPDRWLPPAPVIVDSTIEGSANPN